MNIFNREGRDKLAYIEIQKIIEEELDGIPNLPEEFGDLLKSPMVMILCESAPKHLKRIENSFFVKLNGVLYLTLNDLVRRYKDYRREMLDHIWLFKLDPWDNDGLLINFHEVFRVETFFKNPYEVLADHSEIKEIRPSQIKHGLNKMHFTGMLIGRILEYFVHWNLSLSVMGRNGQKLPIFGPKMHILDQFWPFLGQKS